MRVAPTSDPGVFEVYIDGRVASVWVDYAGGWHACLGILPRYGARDYVNAEGFLGAQVAAAELLMKEASP